MLGCIAWSFSTLSSQYLLPMAHAEAQVTQFLVVNLLVAGQRKPREAERAMFRIIHQKDFEGYRSISHSLLGAMFGTLAVVGTAFIVNN